MERGGEAQRWEQADKIEMFDFIITLTQLILVVTMVTSSMHVSADISPESQKLPVTVQVH